ncbi:hypothetical protein [Streptomyces phaeochromogenes]|uniref:hypothetical protein n=1 Tax=Streptomyces phaeochromogenes TaxID=1923 RepID=UPI0036BB45DD
MRARESFTECASGANDTSRDFVRAALFHRVPYGTEVTIPEGPAKGFVVTEAITGPARAEE